MMMNESVESLILMFQSSFPHQQESISDS